MNLTHYTDDDLKRHFDDVACLAEIGRRVVAGRWTMAKSVDDLEDENNELRERLDLLETA